MPPVSKRLVKDGRWQVPENERPSNWRSMPILEAESNLRPRSKSTRHNHVAIDLRKFEDWDYANNFPSLEKVGMLFNEIRSNYRAGNFEEIKALPFVRAVYPPSFYVGPSRKHIPSEVRRDVLSSGPCVRCGTFEFITVDHIVPVSLGGGDERSNLQPMCFWCNVSKGNRRIGV